MSNELRPIEAAKQTASKAREYVRTELSLLPDRRVCPDCDTPMEATHAYDPRTAAFHAETNGKAPAWECPDCGRQERRETDGPTFDPFA